MLEDDEPPARKPKKKAEKKEVRPMPIRLGVHVCPPLRPATLLTLVLILIAGPCPHSLPAGFFSRKSSSPRLMPRPNSVRAHTGREGHKGPEAQGARERALQG